jgi:cysteine desulfurase family protein
MSRIVYLDNASTSWPKPPEVGEAMVRFLSEGSATPGRGGYRMAARNADLVERCRRRLGELIGVNDPARMVLATGATEAINIAIAGLFAWGADRPWHVVTTSMDHNSVRRPLLHFRRIGRIRLDAVSADEQGRVTPDHVAAAVTDETALVAIIAVSNALGTILPYHQVAQAVRRRNPRTLILLDASQAVGILSVNAADFDLVAFPGHKGLLGPTGTGILYVSRRATGEEWDACLTLQPARFGGTGGESAREDMPEHMPQRFETGSLNTVGFAGLLAALDARPMSHAESLAHERRLIGRLIDHLRSTRGARVLGPERIEERAGLASFTLEGWTAPELASVLDTQFGICCRAGLHCAPGAHASAGTFDAGGAVRVSVGPYNTDDDVETLIEAIQRIV